MICPGQWLIPHRNHDALRANHQKLGAAHSHLGLPVSKSEYLNFYVCSFAEYHQHMFPDSCLILKSSPSHHLSSAPPWLNVTLIPPRISWLLMDHPAVSWTMLGVESMLAVLSCWSAWLVRWGLQDTPGCLRFLCFLGGWVDYNPLYWDVWVILYILALCIGHYHKAGCYSTERRYGFGTLFIWVINWRDRARWIGWIAVV